MNEQDNSPKHNLLENLGDSEEDLLEHYNYPWPILILSKLNIWRENLSKKAEELTDSLGEAIKIIPVDIEGLQSTICFENGRELAIFTRYFRTIAIKKLEIPLLRTCPLIAEKIETELIEKLCNSEEFDSLGIGKFAVKYKIENVSTSRINLLGGLLATEEFVISNSFSLDESDLSLQKMVFGDPMKSKQRLPLETVAFFDQRFKSCFIYVTYGTLDRMNLTIILLPKTIEQLYKRFNIQDKNIVVNTEKNLQRSSIPPKYEGHKVLPPLADFIQLRILFDKLDVNGDNLVCIDDLRKYKDRNNLPINDSDLIRLVENSNIRKKMANKYMLDYNIMESLSDTDVFNEVRYQYRISTGQKPYYEYKTTYPVWIELLKSAGLSLPEAQGRNLNLKEIKSVADIKSFRVPAIQSFSTQVKENENAKKQRIKPIAQNFIKSGRKPEAGVVINTTGTVIEIKPKKTYESDKRDAVFLPDIMEELINQKMDVGDDMRKMPTMGFAVKETYEEAIKYSHNPILIKQQTVENVHPLERFVPERRDPFDFAPVERHSQEVKSAHYKNRVYTETASQGFYKPGYNKTIAATTGRGLIPSATATKSRFRLPSTSKFSQAESISKQLYKPRPVTSGPRQPTSKGFVNNFKPIDCRTLKQKLAFEYGNHRKDEPPQPFIDREYIVKGGNAKIVEPPRFITAFKPDHGTAISSYLLDKKKEKKAENKYRREIANDDHEKIHSKPWKNYIKTSHKLQELATGKPIEYLEKGEYEDIFTKNTRYEIDSSLLEKPPFKLFIKALGAKDKNKVFGE